MSDADYGKIHPHVKNLLGPARLRGILGQLKQHGAERVYSIQRTTGTRANWKPSPEDLKKFFIPPKTVVPPFRLREEFEVHLLWEYERPTADGLIRAALEG